MFFGINQICLTDLLNSQILTIFILHNHQKRDGNVTCFVLLVMRKIKETLAARRRKKAA